MSYCFRIFLLMIVFLLLFKTCAWLLYQNDFITSQIVFKNKKEIIFYDVYRIGIDNYRIEFKTIVNSDTNKLFEDYINDGIYSDNTYKCMQKSDSVTILTNYPITPFIRKTKAGTLIILRKR